MVCPECSYKNSETSGACAKCGTQLPLNDLTLGAEAQGWSEPAEDVVLSPTTGQLSGGTVIGDRYEILQLLGQGGMGAVYKARDKELDRIVALKLIRPEFAKNPEILRRFKQELILARQVTHRNVIRIFDLGQADGVKFITMDFVEGQDLRHLLLEKGKFSPEQAARIMLQICRALEAAHSEGVIHRDLKPQNIMLDAKDRVYVMDFGIARSAYLPGMTQTGALLGTPEYMSPEQARGEKLTEQSDIFSLGVIFYELLTGKSPYHSEVPLATLWKRMHEKATPPIVVDPSIPQVLNDIVVKALEIEPEKRFASAREMAQILEIWLGPSAESSTIALPAPRARAYWKWASAGVAGLLAAAVLVFWLKGPSKPKPPHAPLTVLVGDFNNYTGDPIFDDTLEPMFNVALEGASFINAYNRGAARKAAEKLPHPTNKLDEQSARLVAIEQGINCVITGEIIRRGDHYSVSVTALDAVTGNVLTQAEANPANKDQVLLEIPKLAAPIRRALGDTTPESVQLAATQGSFASSNLEAVHQYGTAMEQEFAGNMEGALQSLSKAAELDPNFARAYAGIAAVDVNLGRRQDAEKYAKMAMEHVERLTERERYRIRGLYYIATRNWPQCVEEYSHLVQLYPADITGQENLGACYGSMYNMPKAVEEARRAVELAPKNLMARMDFYLLACLTGDFKSCERGGQQVISDNPSYHEGYLVLAYAFQGQGQMEKAAQTYQELGKLGARGASLEVSGLANIALYEGRYRQAVQILERGAAADVAAKQPDRAADDFAMLADAELQRSEKQSALAAAEKALVYSQSAKIKFLAARVFLQAGDAARARKLASELASGLEVEPQAYAQLILGEAALEDQRPKDALQFLTNAKKLADMWIVHLELGQTYLEAGDFVEADSEFDDCLKRRGEALELFTDDMPTYSYLPPVYYYEGRALEGLKSPGAADSYHTYLSIRGKAGEDSLLPDVRQRLEKLNAHP
jgi:serine/threonine protein kinase/Tfp pilus assembly protein PilF